MARPLSSATQLAINLCSVLRLGHVASEVCHPPNQLGRSCRTAIRARGVSLLVIQGHHLQCSVVHCRHRRRGSREVLAFSHFFPFILRLCRILSLHGTSWKLFPSHPCVRMARKCVRHTCLQCTLFLRVRKLATWYVQSSTQSDKKPKPKTKTSGR